MVDYSTTKPDTIFHNKKLSLAFQSALKQFNTEQTTKEIELNRLQQKNLKKIEDSLTNLVNSKKNTNEGK